MEMLKYLFYNFKIMKKRIATIFLFLLVLFLGAVNAFSPPPFDEKIKILCTNTGGKSYSRSFTPYCGDECRAAPATFEYCLCPNGIIWKNVEFLTYNKNWTGCNTIVDAEHQTYQNENYTITQDQFNQEIKIQGKQKPIIESNTYFGLHNIKLIIMLVVIITMISFVIWKKRKSITNKN